MSPKIIYLAHAKEYPDFKQTLYLPLANTISSKNFELIMPHQMSNSPFDSREMIFGKKVDLVLAELSYPATGLGIEIGWANSQNIPIIGIAKSNFKISNSAIMVCDDFLIYDRLDLDFIEFLLQSIQTIVVN